MKLEFREWKDLKIRWMHVSLRLFMYICMYANIDQWNYRERVMRQVNLGVWCPSRLGPSCCIDSRIPLTTWPIEARTRHDIPHHVRVSRRVFDRPSEYYMCVGCVCICIYAVMMIKFSIFQVYLLSVFVKFLTISEKMYRSTDFEVHRNWLSLTFSLPFEQWYTDSRNQWSLDYPPFFAYFEYILSKIANFFPNLQQMLNVNNIDYINFGTIIFQRLSVIAISDAILLLGLYCAAPRNKNVVCALGLFSSTLFIVDHVHFQYNGMLLGILLLSIYYVESGKFYAGALTYFVLIYFKHIFLFCAPVYLCHYLRFFVGISIRKFLNLLAILLAVSAVALGPLIYTNQLVPAIHRLFPFGRGLMHANWTPNFWSLYLACDLVLGKITGNSAKSNITRGIVGVSHTAVLPDITPTISLGIVLLMYIPLLVVQWKIATRYSFAQWVAFGNAIVFAFGYHIHEKAALMFLLPLLIHTATVDHTRVHYKILSFSVCCSVIQLIFRDTDSVLKWTILFTGFAMEGMLLPSATSLVYLISIYPEIYRISSGYMFINNDYPFIPIILNNSVNAMVIGYSVVSYFKNTIHTPQPKQYVRVYPVNM